MHFCSCKKSILNLQIRLFGQSDFLSHKSYRWFGTEAKTKDWTFFVAKMDHKFWYLASAILQWDFFIKVGQKNVLGIICLRVKSTFLNTENIGENVLFTIYLLKNVTEFFLKNKNLQTLSWLPCKIFHSYLFLSKYFSSC